MKRFFLLIAFVHLLVLAATAQQQPAAAGTPAAHPLDVEIERCISQNATLLGSVECHLIGYQKWTAEMERIYTALLAKLDDESKLILKDQQTQWLKLRDAQFEFNEKFYGKRGAFVLMASVKTDVARRRALELQGYLDLAGR